MVVDKTKLLANVDVLNSHLGSSFEYRMVAKSLPSLNLLQLVSERSNSHRFMLFHEPFIKQVAEKRYFLRLFWDGEIVSIQRDGYLTKAEASQLELDVPIESTWMAVGGKRKLPAVPDGVLEQEQERRKRKRAVGADGGR